MYMYTYSIGFSKVTIGIKKLHLFFEKTSPIAVTVHLYEECWFIDTSSKISQFEFYSGFIEGSLLQYSFNFPWTNY